MNRAEYRNAIRDLLALDVDVSALPADDATYGFDNIADALGTSPLLLESYVTMARKISRTGPRQHRRSRPSRRPIRRPEDLTQDYHLRDLPLGTRGGLRVEEYFAGRRRVRDPRPAAAHRHRLHPRNRATSISSS